MSDSLWPHGLYNPWNSLGQNTGVGGLSVLRGIFPTQGSNPGLLHCGPILYPLSHKGSPNSSVSFKRKQLSHWVSPGPRGLTASCSSMRIWVRSVECWQPEVMEMGREDCSPSTVVHPPPPWVHLQGWIPNNRTSLPQMEPFTRGQGSH